jgi:RNA polymerase sigma-70 factor (ECF subfamily)
VDELTALARAARHGDDAALAAFVRAAQTDVWRFCAHLVSAEAADDLTQETFIRAARSLPGFQERSSARTWLLAIARRVAADEIRGRQRRRRLAERLRVGRVEPTASPETTVALTDALARLDDDRRAAFVLTQGLGLSYEDAADVCRCPVGTIRSRVARARGDLVAALEAAEVE